MSEGLDLRGKEKMKCKVCNEGEGEVSVLNEQGDVVLVCFKCADNQEEKLSKQRELRSCSQSEKREASPW